MADEARALAEQLNDENTRRQEEEATIVAEARKLVETDPDVGAHNVLVVGGEGWHRGVIGIVASKLVDRFHKPAIVLSIDGDEVHGSCRSIPAFDMLGALEGCADLLGRYGGHRQAAGLSLERGRLAEFRARINGLADARLEPDDLVPRLRVDARAGAAGADRRGGAGRRGAGAVRPGQPAAGVRGPRRRGGQRPAPAEGPPPQPCT